MCIQYYIVHGKERRQDLLQNKLVFKRDFEVIFTTETIAASDLKVTAKRCTEQLEHKLKQSQGKINILRLTCRAGASLAAFVPALGTSGGFSSSATYDIGRVYGLICKRFGVVSIESIGLKWFIDLHYCFRTSASQTFIFPKGWICQPVFGLATVDGIVRRSRYLGLHLCTFLVKSC